MANGSLILDSDNGSRGLTTLYSSGLDAFNVYCLADNGQALQGWGGNGGTGVYGVVGPGGAGIVGDSQYDEQTYAGLFIGKVGVYFGNFTVWGGDVTATGNLIITGSKSAAVRHPDGSNRLLYSMESPECWFEDFGKGKLVRGRTKVKLDRDFAAVVRTASYYVFLTPEDDSHGLYVYTKNKMGFEVREQQNGKSSVRFSYRIVAKRKDIAGPRLPKVELPKPAKLPKPRLKRVAGTRK